MTIPIEALALLPGFLRLVDNRVMAGEQSSWMPIQPVTICVMHPKHTKDENRAAMQAIIDIVNAARASYMGVEQSK